MISNVIEFNCQYSDQIRKKHKVWHDGKLKYYQINNRFLLYSEDDVMLSSTFVSSSKEVQCYLDEENFDQLEHKIFGGFVVIISDIITKYSREIQHMKANSTPKEPEILSPNAHQQNKVKGSANKVDYINPKYNKPDDIEPMNKKRILVKNEQSSRNMSSKSNGMTSSGLALKFNSPFRPPRMISNNSTMKYNRPSIRNATVKNESTHIKTESKVLGIRNNTSNAVDLMVKTNAKMQDKIYQVSSKQEFVVIPKEEIPTIRIPKPHDQNIIGNKVKTCKKRVNLFKSRKVVHKRLQIPS